MDLNDWKILFSMTDKFRVDGVNRSYEVIFFSLHIMSINLNALQIHIKIFSSDDKIAVHRRITENDNLIILRSLTTHNMKGLRLGPVTEILASFTDDLKITHLGKYLKVMFQMSFYFIVSYFFIQVYLGLMVTSTATARILNLHIRLIGSRISQGVARNILPSIDFSSNIELK